MSGHVPDWVRKNHAKTKHMADGGSASAEELERWDRAWNARTNPDEPTKAEREAERKYQEELDRKAAKDHEAKSARGRGGSARGGGGGGMRPDTDITAARGRLKF